jgi:hypothetical protein
VHAYLLVGSDGPPPPLPHRPLSTSSQPAETLFHCRQDIYRPHLRELPGPVVHEFAPVAEEPYAPAPKALLAELHNSRNLRRRSTRYKQTLLKIRRCFLIRCIHRLINTRVLRASLAISGISDIQYDRVDDKADWPKSRVLRWREQELAMTANEHDTEYDGWWSQRTGAANAMTNRQTFPHMSQRCMWSAPIMLAVLSEMELIEDHICENVFNSCISNLRRL